MSSRQQVTTQQRLLIFNADRHGREGKNLERRIYKAADKKRSAITKGIVLQAQNIEVERLVTKNRQMDLQIQELRLLLAKSGSDGKIDVQKHRHEGKLDTANANKKTLAAVAQLKSLAAELRHAKAENRRLRSAKSDQLVVAAASPALRQDDDSGAPLREETRQQVEVDQENTQAENAASSLREKDDLIRVLEDRIVVLQQLIAEQHVTANNRKEDLGALSNKLHTVGEKFLKLSSSCNMLQFQLLESHCARDKDTALVRAVLKTIHKK